MDKIKNRAIPLRGLIHLHQLERESHGQMPSASIIKGTQKGQHFLLYFE